MTGLSRSETTVLDGTGVNCGARQSAVQSRAILLTNNGVLAFVQAQSSYDMVHALHLLLSAHGAGQPQHGCEIQRLVHGQGLIEQVILHIEQINLASGASDMVGSSCTMTSCTA